MDKLRVVPTEEPPTYNRYLSGGGYEIVELIVPESLFGDYSTFDELKEKAKRIGFVAGIESFSSIVDGEIIDEPIYAVWYNRRVYIGFMGNHYAPPMKDITISVKVADVERI